MFMRIKNQAGASAATSHGLRCQQKLVKHLDLFEGTIDSGVHHVRVAVWYSTIPLHFTASTTAFNASTACSRTQTYRSVPF